MYKFLKIRYLEPGGIRDRVRSIALALADTECKAKRMDLGEM